MLQSAVLPVQDTIHDKQQQTPADSTQRLHTSMLWNVNDKGTHWYTNLANVKHGVVAERWEQRDKVFDDHLLTQERG